MGNSMKYSIKEFTYKVPQSESPKSLLSVVASGFLDDKFSNYDADKSLGKSRHLSAATKLWSSAANKLLTGNLLTDTLSRSPEKIGIFLAVENINLEDDFIFDLCAKNYGPDYVSPLKAPNTLANVVGSYFARFSGITGPNCTLSAGQSGGMHGLDLAMLSLDNGAVELAIVGAVEVKSDYHSRIDVASREVAISCLLAHADDNDDVVIYPPLLQTRPNITEVDIAKKIAEEATKHLGKSNVDMVWLAAGVNQLEQDQFATAIAGCGVSHSLLLGEKLFSTGESCNTLLFCSLANEIMKTDNKSLNILKPLTLGILPECLSSVAIVSLDNSGQIAILIQGRK